LQKSFPNLQARRDTNKQYSYVDTNQWKKDFVHACADHQQSPVNIKLNKCLFPSNLTQLKITGWNVVPLKTVLKATGKTVEFWNTYKSEKPRITGGPLGNNVYGLYQFHFHWGQDEL
jgi:carbonic anhydrase